MDDISLSAHTPVEEDADQPVFPEGVTFPIRDYTPVDYGVNVSRADIEYDNRKAADTDENAKKSEGISIESPWVAEERRKFAIDQATSLNLDNVSDLLDAAEKIVNYIVTGQTALTPAV